MGDRGPAPMGKGFFSGKGGDRCLLPASFHQKKPFKTALTQLKASHRPFKQSHCSGHLASDVPTWDSNWKSQREIASAVESVCGVSGERLRQGDTPDVGSISRRVCERTVYGD